MLLAFSVFFTLPDLSQLFTDGDIYHYHLVFYIVFYSKFKEYFLCKFLPITFVMEATDDISKRFHSKFGVGTSVKPMFLKRMKPWLKLIKIKNCKRKINFWKEQVERETKHRSRRKLNSAITAKVFVLMEPGCMIDHDWAVWKQLEITPVPGWFSILFSC